MENVNVDFLRRVLAPSVLECLTEDKPSTSRLCGTYDNTDEFFESLHEAELAGLECSPLKAAAATSEFKTTSNGYFKCIIENNSNSNIKRAANTSMTQPL